MIEAAQGTDYPIIIVGAGPIEQELKAQVAKLGLLNTHFLGHLLGLPKMWRKRQQIQKSRIASISDIWRVLDKHLIPKIRKS